MKNIAITTFIQVSETESALVMTFRKPTREITDPGLYFKWPAPIERVSKFDSRMRVFEADLGETTTKGAVPIIVNTYVVWKISEPLQFFNTNNRGSVEEAKSKLRSQINDTQNRVIGLHEFSEFVNSDPSRIKFGQIEGEMLTDLQEAISDANYGIEIRALGIKQLKISKDVSEDVFKRMRAERNRKTEAIVAQGTSAAMRIRTDADSKKTELLAAAEARAKAIRGQGDAEAAKYYEMLRENPELAMFLRNTEALKETLKEKTTLVIEPDVEPFTLFRKRPDIVPRKPD
jgi:membrane protease subunit HflC